MWKKLNLISLQTEGLQQINQIDLQKHIKKIEILNCKNEKTTTEKKNQNQVYPNSRSRQESEKKESELIKDSDIQLIEPNSKVEKKEKPMEPSINLEQSQAEKYYQFELISKQKLDLSNFKFELKDIFGNQQIQKDQIKFEIKNCTKQKNNLVSFEKHLGIFLVQFTKPKDINDSNISFSGQNLEQRIKQSPLEIVQINIQNQLYLLIGVGEGYLDIVKYIQKKQRNFDEVDQIYQVIIKYLQILLQISFNTYQEYQKQEQNKDFDIDDSVLADFEENIIKQYDDNEKLVIYIQNICQLLVGYGKYKGLQIYDKRNKIQQKYVMVGVLGNINKGKTFVINRLSRDENNMSREGELQRTQGISVTTVIKKNKTFLYADIEGNQQANNLNLKKIDKIFSNDIQKENIPYILSDDEQNAIEDLKAYLKYKTEQSYLQQVIIIRNLKNKKCLADLKQAIDQECFSVILYILKLFVCPKYYLGDHDSCQEVKDYNLMVFEDIKSNIQNTQFNMHETDIIINIQKFMKQFIQNYFKLLTNNQDQQIDLVIGQESNGVKVLSLNQNDSETNFVVNHRAIEESKFGFISSNLIYTIKEAQLSNNSKDLIAEIEFPGINEKDFINSLDIKQKSTNITIQSKQLATKCISNQQQLKEQSSAKGRSNQQYPQMDIKINHTLQSEQYITDTIKQDINEQLIDDEDKKISNDVQSHKVEQEKLENVRQKKLQSFSIQIPIKPELDENNNTKNIDHEFMDKQYKQLDKIISLKDGIFKFKFQIKYEVQQNQIQS
ncbi:hypothetical protein ABPG72_009948 [Tetrahymena utriculariae]